MKVEALLDVVEATIDMPIISSDQKIELLKQLISNIRNNDALNIE